MVGKFQGLQLHSIWVFHISLSFSTSCSSNLDFTTLAAYQADSGGRAV